jgi:hypothetical protein
VSSGEGASHIKRLDELFGLDSPPRAAVDADGNTVSG